MGALPQCNSHWTGCICASYFLSAGLMYFYHMSSGKRGWRHTLISQSSYGMVRKKDMIFSDPIFMSVYLPTSPPQLEEDTQTEGGSDSHPASSQTEGGQATTHLSNSYRTTTRPDLNWNMSSSKRHRSWIKGTNLSKLNRPRGMQEGRHSC